MRRKMAAPLNVVPETLKVYSKKFMGLSKIQIVCRLKPIEDRNYMEFMNGYGPSIRFNNSHLKVERTLDQEQPTPLIKLYDLESKPFEELEMVSFKSAEEIIAKIEKINSTQCKKAGVPESPADEPEN
jgi:hypothetical protein